MLVTNADWSSYARRFLIVTSLSVASGAGARGIVTLQGEGIPAGTTGAIFHKRDFQNLQEALAMRDQGEERLVVVEWSSGHLTGIRKLFASFTPRLTVGVFTRAAFDLQIDREAHAELGGEARARASMPLRMWEPV